jgi:hypothetical protein
MRRSVLIALAGLALIAACSKQTQTSASSDLKSAGRSLDRAVTDVAHDPALKGAGADARKLGQEAATDLRHAGQQAKSATQGAADDTKHAAHRATDG